MARKLRYNDEEGGMVKAQLMKIENYAAKLNDMIHPDDEIEGWVQAKLAVVAAYMGDVKHYLDYELQQSFADGGGVGGFKPRYWEVEFTWEGEAEGDGRKVNVMADSVAEAEQKVKDKFGMYYKGLKVVEVEEDKEMTWDEYAATKGVKKMADGGMIWASPTLRKKYESAFGKDFKPEHAIESAKKESLIESYYWNYLLDVLEIEELDEKAANDWKVATEVEDGKLVEKGPYRTRYMYSPSLDRLRKQNEGEWYRYGSVSDTFAKGGMMADGGQTQGKNGYVAFYKGKRIEVYADTMYQAQLKAAKIFNAKKSYEVNVVLAEVDGKQYYNSTMADGGMMAKGGMVKELEFNDTKWYLTYDDPTHFFLSNSRDFKGTPYHIGQFRGRPFYNEVNEWLKETSRQSKMADGGLTSEESDKLTKLQEEKDKLKMQELDISMGVKGGKKNWEDKMRSINDEINTLLKKKYGWKMAEGGEVMVELKRRGFSNSEAERLVKKHDYLVDVADTAEEAANDIERYDDSENEFPDVPELKFSKGGDTITFPDGYQFKKVSKDFATKNWANKEIYGLDLESNTEALIENAKDLTRFEVFAEEVGFKEDGGDIEDEREQREERREMMERRYEADREEAAIRQLEKRKVKLEDLMRHDDLYFIGNIYDSDTDGWVSKFEAQKIIDKVNAERLEDGGELGLKKNWVLKPVFVQLDKPSDIKLNRVRRQVEDYASQGFRSADILLKMAFITDEPKLLEDQFQKIKNSIYYQKDIKKYYRGGKMEDEFLKYEGSSFYDDFNEAKQYVGDAVWNDMSYDDKVQATKYLKATGKIGWFGEYEDLETVAASMYKRGGSVGKYLVAVNQKKTNIVSKMLVDSLSDIDRRQYEVLSVKKLG